MILSDQDIKALVDSGALVIDPAPEACHIQPASIDVHVDLSKGALRPVVGCKVVIGPDGISGAAYVRTPPGVIELAPGECALVAVRERVTIPADHSLQVDGRSSIGRLFLAVHVTAGWCDAGFEGQITLEVVNLSRFDIQILDGVRLAQLKVCRLTSPAEAPYGAEGRGSHYQGQMGATAPAQEEP